MSLPSPPMPDTAPEFPPFRSRPPWWGGDLQTLRNTLAARGGGVRSSRAAPGERLWVDLQDDTGDALAVSLERPEAPRPGVPWLLLVHGLGGDEASAYVAQTAARGLARGHTVLRLNLRGAGPSRERCRFQYHAGRTQDLEAALVHLAARFPELSEVGAVLVGYSLGGNLVLKWAGEGAPGPGVRGVAAVSAPIDLSEAARRFMSPRNRFYHWHMMRRLRREATAPGAQIDDRERQLVRAARSLYDFDDRFVAPRAGFASADDYYAGCSALPGLARIELPALAMHAADDPWIPPRPYQDGLRRGLWPDNVRVVVASGGGHVGFHAAGGSTWHDDCLVRWLDALPR